MEPPQHLERGGLDAHVINYADDLVICCRPGNGPAALATMRQLMARLGLTVNEAKTRLARLPEESFDFLGYTIGRFYGKDGASYLGTCPSRKAVRRLLQQIHDATTPHKHAESPDLRALLWHFGSMLENPTMAVRTTIRNRRPSEQLGDDGAADFRQ